MRFVDSNIFLHAMLIPRRQLNARERKMKDGAKSILRRIEEGEEVATTTVHLSEVLNLVEARLGLDRSLGLLGWAVASSNLHVFAVAEEDYESSLRVAVDCKMSANDALAWHTMRKNNFREIYSFDAHLDGLKGLLRVDA